MDLDVALSVYSFFAGAFLLFLTGKRRGEGEEGGGGGGGGDSGEEVRAI